MEDKGKGPERSIASGERGPFKEVAMSDGDMSDERASRRIMVMSIIAGGDRRVIETYRRMRHDGK